MCFFGYKQGDNEFFAFFTRRYINKKNRQNVWVVGGLLPTADSTQRGLHPVAKFQQYDNIPVKNIDNINFLSTDIFNGNIDGSGSSKTYIIKTFPASPAYMYQEAICLYPISRYWRAKVDGVWRSWIKI